MLHELDTPAIQKRNLSPPNCPHKHLVTIYYWMCTAFTCAWPRPLPPKKDSQYLTLSSTHFYLATWHLATCVPWKCQRSAKMAGQRNLSCCRDCKVSSGGVGSSHTGLGEWLVEPEEAGSGGRSTCGAAFMVWTGPMPISIDNCVTGDRGVEILWIHSVCCPRYNSQVCAGSMSSFVSRGGALPMITHILMAYVPFLCHTGICFVVWLPFVIWA